MAEQETTETVATSAAAPAEAPATTPAPTPVANAESSIPADATPEKLWKEIQDLRKESGNYRNRSKKYEETFSKFDPDAEAGWLELVNNFATNPTTAAQQMKDIAEAVLADQEEAGVTKGDPEFVSKAEVEKMLKSQVADIEQQRLVSEIETEAQKLGYNPKSDDLNTRLDYEDLVRVAMTLPNYSLAEAHKLLEARKQGQVDAYLKAKQEQAGKTPKAPVAGGAAPSQENAPKEKTFEAAKESALAKIAAINQA